MDNNIESRLRSIEDKQVKAEIHSDDRIKYEKTNKDEHKVIYDKLENMTGMLHVQKGFLKGIFYILSAILSLVAVFQDYFLSK